MCQEFGAGIDGAGVRHGDVEALAEFYDCAYYGFEFDRAAGSLSKAIAHAPRNREEREKVWRVSRAKRC